MDPGAAAGRRGCESRRSPQLTTFRRCPRSPTGNQAAPAFRAGHRLGRTSGGILRARRRQSIGASSRATGTRGARITASSTRTKTRPTTSTSSRRVCGFRDRRITSSTRGCLRASIRHGGRRSLGALNERATPTHNPRARSFRSRGQIRGG